MKLTTTNKFIMKKSLLLTVFLSLNMMIFAQSFPLKSSRWYYSNNGGNQPPNSSLKIIEFEKDTVINDTLSRKLSNGLMFYSEKELVYFYNSEQNRFGLIFDFNAKPNDTLTIIAPPNIPSEKLLFKVKIDSVKKKVYSNDTIVKFYNTSLDPDFHFENNVYMTRIGAYGFLPQYGFSIPEGDYLKCYEDSSLYINYSGIPCDSVVTGTVITKLNGRFSIFPNPATNEIFISNELKENLQIEIFDNIGKLYFQTRLHDNEERIDISELISGIYFIRIEKENGEFFTMKLIVE